MIKLDAIFNKQRCEVRGAAAEAAALLGAWRRVERMHLPVSFGCSCGAMGHVSVLDFERDVLDYLCEKHSANAPAKAMLQRFAIEDSDRGGALAALLQGLAALPDDGQDDPKLQLVADLRRSIGSWLSAFGPKSTDTAVG